MSDDHISKALGIRPLSEVEEKTEIVPIEENENLPAEVNSQAEENLLPRPSILFRERRKRKIF